jgi:hypothetical protein
VQGWQNNQKPESTFWQGFYDLNKNKVIFKE